MFDIGFWELTLIAVVALLVVGPERLPGMARTVGLYAGKLRRWVSQVRGEVERELRTEEIRQAMREAERSEAVRSLGDAMKMGDVGDAVRSAGAAIKDAADADTANRAVSGDDNRPEPKGESPSTATTTPAVSSAAPAADDGGGSTGEAIATPMDESEPSLSPSVSTVSEDKRERGTG